VGSIDKRIEHLERLYHTASAERGGRGREELVRKAWIGTLDAIAHIRRAPIDAEPWRYEVEKLRGKNPFAIACHVAALAHLEHPDEEEARRILEEELAGRELEEDYGETMRNMADGLARALDRIREERE
jgi:hypothetical protein